MLTALRRIPLLDYTRRALAPTRWWLALEAVIWMFAISSAATDCFLLSVPSPRFAYAAAVLALIALLYKIFLLPSQEIVRVARRRIKAWSEPYAVQRAWITASSPGTDDIQRSGLKALATFLAFWLIRVGLCILLFAAIYYSQNVPAGERSTVEQKVLKLNFYFTKPKLPEIDEALYASIMMQFFVSAPPRSGTDLTVRDRLARLQVLSSLLLFTISLLLIQQFIAEGIKESDIRNAVVSLCLTAWTRSTLRGGLIYLASTQSQTGKEFVEVLRRSYRNEVVEEVLNVFLLKPDALARLSHGDVRWLKARRGNVGQQAEKAFGKGSNRLNLLNDKLQLVERYVDMLS